MILLCSKRSVDKIRYDNNALGIINDWGERAK